MSTSGPQFYNHQDLEHEAMKPTNGNGGLPRWAWFVIGCVVVPLVLFVVPWFVRAYDPLHPVDQTPMLQVKDDRITELLDERSELKAELREANARIAELAAQLQYTPPLPSTEPDTWPAPSTLDATQSDSLDRLEDAIATVERIQAAWERMEAMVERPPDIGESPEFIALRNDVAAMDAWAHKVRDAMRAHAGWILWAARQHNTDAGEPCEPKLPRDYSAHPNTILQN